jgi:hypothetical protein
MSWAERYRHDREVITFSSTAQKSIVQSGYLGSFLPLLFVGVPWAEPNYHRRTCIAMCPFFVDVPVYLHDTHGSVVVNTHQRSI